MKTCKCGKQQRKGGRYCVDCHSLYMREWRKTNLLTPEQKVKDTCRSYANVYLRRGKIKKESCIICGSIDSQMHHEDYSKPLDIVWSDR